MNDLLEKLAAIIEWCEKHGADEPHRLACEAKEAIEHWVMVEEAGAELAAGGGYRLKDVMQQFHAMTDAIINEDHDIHPDQAVS